MSFWSWLGGQWHKGVIVLLALDHLAERLYPLWEKIHRAEEFIERRYHQRRHQMPTDFASKVAKGFQVLNIALANAPKVMADIAAVEASQKDPAAEIAALQQLLADVQPAVQALIALVPPPPAPAPAATQPPPPVAS